MNWRLPTKDELNWLYQNKKELFKPLAYWSSSENFYNNAWSQYFDNGYRFNYNKINNILVRPIRGILPDLEIYEEDLGFMTWDNAMEACEKLNASKREKWECASCPQSCRFSNSGSRVKPFCCPYSFSAVDWHKREE